MEKYIVKVQHGPTNTRINLPREVLIKKDWLDVRFVIIEDQHEDTLTIRRFVDGESLKGKDLRG